MKPWLPSLVLLVGTNAVAYDGNVYGIGGTGRASDGSSTGYQGGQYGYEYETGANSRVGVMYYNEGTPENNHRDGFAVLGWYNHKVTQDLSVQAGVGYNFKDAREDIIRKNIEASVWGGNSHTTRGGADMVRGFQVEVRRMQSSHVAYSVSLIYEGDTKVTDRKGVAGQIWYVTKSENNWTFSVGAGPYLAHDDVEDKTKLLAIASLGLSKNISKNVKIGIRFNRVISGNNKDQDMFLIGVEKKF